MDLHLELGELRERTRAALGNQNDGGDMSNCSEEGCKGRVEPRPVHQPRWRRAFGMDLRALAASRILVSCVVFYEGFLGLDWWNVRAFLTDEGVWPRLGVVTMEDARLWQLHMIHGGTFWAYFLHFLFLVSGLLLLIGWHTRKASMYCCLYWISVQNRNHFIAHAFDKQLTYMFLWGALGLPWSDCLSVDAVLTAGSGHGVDQPHQLMCSAATFGLGVQTTIIYLTTAFHKSCHCWFEGTAVIYALNLRYISRPIGQILIQNAATRWLLSVASQATRPLELVAPLAMLTPWCIVKAVGALSLICFHLGIAFTFRLNDIPFINVSALLAFLPTLFWESLQVAWLRVAAPSCACWQPWTLIRQFAEILCKLDLAAPATNVPKTVAMERQESASRALRNISAIWIIVWQAWATIATVCGGAEGDPCKHRWWNMWPSWSNAGIALRLDMNWKVFSPRPPYMDWWCVFPATLESNQTVNIFPALHGPRFFKEPFAAAIYDAPQEPAYTLRDERWTKYFENIVMRRETEVELMEKLRLWLGQFLCREWNMRYGSSSHRLKNFTMLLFTVDNSFVHIEPPAPLVQTLWNQTC